MFGLCSATPHNYTWTFTSGLQSGFALYTARGP